MAVRAVLDTDMLVSALLNPSGTFAALLARQFQAVSSEPLLQELEEALTDSKIRCDYRVTERDVRLLKAVLRKYGRKVETQGRSGFSHDPGDDKVVETVLVGKARYLVTYNTRHFTTGWATTHLAKARVTVLNPAAFLDLLRAGPLGRRRRAGKFVRRLRS